MNMRTKPPSIRSTHLEDTAQSIARLRVDHEQKATRLERMVDRVTARAGSPGFVVLLTAALVSWIGLNSTLLLVGRQPLDAPPFFWMQGAISLGALYMTVLGPVAGLVGIEGGVVSGVFNLESPGVRAPSRRPRHDQRYHEG